MTDVLLYTAATPFQSARRLTGLPAQHRAGRLHGHGFLAKVAARLPSGWAAFAGAEAGALHAALERCVAPLDYRLLNDVIDEPTDANLARWIRARLDVPGIDAIGLQSTAHAGADLDAHDRARVWRRYAFESAHRLPNVPPGHRCGRMHGHGFEAILHADVDRDARTGDTDDRLDRSWAPLHDDLHLACLNDLPGLANPTSEVLASWIYDKLKPALPELRRVTVYETATCGAHYDGARYRIWKELTLDSAVRLKHAPEGDRRRRIHGHTYTLRLHLSATLDRVLGWTVDFGDVKTLFEPIFRELDHQPLYELPGAGDNDVGSLLRWIKARAAPCLPQLDRIDLEELRGCGATLAWGDDDPAAAGVMR